MEKKDIKRIMIAHHDNDFVREWKWIGETLLSTMVLPNYCGEEMLNNSTDIEKFVRSLIPIAIEFVSYRCEGPDSLARGFKRYMDISRLELGNSIEHLEKAKFYYNFEVTHPDWEFGGSETLIIDLENLTSYIR